MTPAKPTTPASRPRERAEPAFWATLAALVVFAAGTVWAALDPAVVTTPGQSMLSDLGAVTCRTAAGRWICSPQHVVFNAAQITAGLLLWCAAWARRQALAGPVVAALSTTGAGLLLLGPFPSDLAHTLHMVGAVLALPAGTALLLAHGLRARARAITWLSAVSLALTAVHLVPGTGLRGTAEVVSLVTMSAAFLLATWGSGGRTPAQ